MFIPARNGSVGSITFQRALDDVMCHEPVPKKKFASGFFGREGMHALAFWASVFFDNFFN